ncbi:MAG: hypothetical protein Kow0063_22840 [Anaerolineae bacterium]
MIAGRDRWQRLWPAAVLVVLPLLVYWPLVFGGRVLYWGVPLYQFYPWHRLVVEAFRSGHLPLWTDLLGNGAPLLANHQSAVFYPFNLIYFLAPVEQAMGYSVVVHLMLAGLFAFAWGRAIGLSRFAATIVGLSFGLSGFLAGRTQFITIVNSAAWLPLLFLFAERLARRRTWLDAVWLGLVMALQFLAGHAQLWFYSLWGVAAYVIARAWRLPSEQSGIGSRKPAQVWRWRGGVFILLAGALILSLGLSAAQLLPTAELSLHSQRSDGLDPAEAMTYSFWPWRLLTLAVPRLFGSPDSGDYWGYATFWEDTGYIGLMPLLLALGAVWGWGRLWLARRTRRAACPEPGTQHNVGLIPFFLALILISLILAMGQNTPVYPLVFKYVPGFDAFRSPARFLLLYTFAVSTLAGIGADRFRLTYRVQYVARLTVAGAVAMLAVALAMGQLDWPVRPTFAPAFATFAILLGLSAILLLLFPARAGRGQDGVDPRVARSPLPLGIWRGLMVCFVALDLAFFAAPLTPGIDAALYRTTTAADRFLLARTDADRIFATYDYDYNTKFNRYFDFSTWGPSDLAYWLSFRETLLPNLNVFSHSRSVNNDDPLVVGRWLDLMETLRAVDWPTRLRLLRMMNVGYVLTESSPPTLAPVEGVANLYRLPEPLPRAWLVPQARIIADPDVLLAELLDPAFDPAAEVLLEGGPLAGSFAASGLGSHSPTVNHPPSAPATVSQARPLSVPISLREEGNSRTIDLIAPQPGYLVLAYTYYLGWRASVDGQPAQILRANYAFMALTLEAGQHRVVLDYRPISLRVGMFISSLSALIIVAAISLRLLSRPGNPRLF